MPVVDDGLEVLVAGDDVLVAGLLVAALEVLVVGDVSTKPWSDGVTLQPKRSDKNGMLGPTQAEAIIKMPPIMKAIMAKMRITIAPP
jgi:hypothetical protein